LLWRSIEAVSGLEYRSVNTLERYYPVTRLVRLCEPVPDASSPTAWASQRRRDCAAVFRLLAVHDTGKHLRRLHSVLLINQQYQKTPIHLSKIASASGTCVPSADPALLRAGLLGCTTEPYLRVSSASNKQASSELGGGVYRLSVRCQVACHPDISFLTTWLVTYRADPKRRASGEAVPSGQSQDLRHYSQRS